MSKKASPAKRHLQDCQPQIIYSDLSKTHPALENYLGYLLHRVTLIFKAAINSRLEKFDVQGPHFAILSIVDHSPMISQNQLCAETGIDKASMVKITDHLENLKLIERKESPVDRRIKNITATAHGKKVLKQTIQIRTQFEAEFLSQLSSEEKKIFKTVLKKLASAKSSI